MKIKRVNSPKSCAVKKDEAVLTINRPDCDSLFKSVLHLNLNFEPVEYDQEMSDEDMAKCFSYTDVILLNEFLDKIADKNNILILCEDDSIYWSLLVILRSIKDIKPCECIYLAVKELPNITPYAWIIYVYEAYRQGTGDLTEELENYVVTKKAFDKFGNCTEGFW